MGKFVLPNNSRYTSRDLSKAYVIPINLSPFYFIQQRHLVKPYEQKVCFVHDVNSVSIHTENKTWTYKKFNIIAENDLQKDPCGTVTSRLAAFPL